VRWAKRLGRRSSRSSHPPGSGIPATYAALLDGDHLWLAIAAEHRDPCLVTADGRVIDPVGDLRPGAGPVRGTERSYRWHLPRTLDTEPVGDVAVMASARGGDREVVLAPPAGLDGRTPARPDRARSYALVRAEDGGLLVRSTAHSPAAALLSASYADGRVGLRVSPPPGAGDALLLLDEDHREAARLPTRREEEDLCVDVGPADFPRGTGPLLVAVAGAEGPVPVVRHDNRLPDPSEVLLPSIIGETGSVARFRFREDGRLVLRPADEEGAQ